MKLQFSKYNPTGNTTILVDSPVPRNLQSRVAARLMAENGVFAEQVGFLEQPANPMAVARLQMMGGEFCGNASMCLASHIALRDGRGDGSVLLEVSGAEELVSVDLRRQGHGFRCRVRMPLPLETDLREFQIDGKPVSMPFVRLPGISFAISESSMPEEQALILARQGCLETQSDAFGVLIASPSRPGARRIRPLVYVRKTDTAVWEHGCGSGSTAMGAYLAWKDGAQGPLDMVQPGGTIRVYTEVGAEGRLSSIFIEGLVVPVCQGTAWVDEPMA